MQRLFVRLLAAACPLLVWCAPFGGVANQCEIVNGTLKRRDLRVALLLVHVEGNLGDEYETTPLIRALKRWGVAQIDCFASSWRDGIADPQAWMSPHGVRTLEGVDHFYPPQWAPSKFFEPSKGSKRKYDVIIWSPGPWGAYTVQKLGTLAYWANSIGTRMMFVGGTMVVQASGDIPRYYSYIKKSKMLFIFREFESNRQLASALGMSQEEIKETSAVSGDLSFSFQAEPVLYDYWTRAYRRILTEKFGDTEPWYLLFVRTLEHIEYNPGSATFVVEIIRRHQQEPHSVSPLHIPLSRVIFATSDVIEDEKLFAELRNTFHPRHPPFFNLENVEQLVALVGAMPNTRIVSDRYHPAVAALRQGADVHVMSNEHVGHASADYSKMIGLLDWLDRRLEYDFCQMNRDAFSVLFRNLDTVRS